MSTLSLDQLSPGQSGKIVSIDCSSNESIRLMEMGLLEGESVDFLAVGPLGDPIDLMIRGYQLSIRKSEASLITVEIN